MDFTVNKRGEYYNLEYLGFKNPNVVFKIHHWNNTYFSKKAEVLNFISYVIKLEKSLTTLKSKHNPKKLIRFYLNMIESIASGHDVRSKWSIDELAERLVDWFDKRLDEANTFCKDTLQFIEDTDGCHMYTDYRRFEQHDRLIDIFELDFTKLGDDYEGFTRDPLSVTLDKASEFLDNLIKTRKNNPKTT